MPGSATIGYASSPNIIPTIVEVEFGIVQLRTFGQLKPVHITHHDVELVE